MAEKKFSELPSAASLTGNELAALSQMQSGSLASVKSTLQAIANWFAVYAQYTTALQTTDKSIAGAINELKQLISLIPQFSIEVVQVLPTEDISDTTIYLVPAEDPEAGNYYEEYIHVNDAWELVGTTAVDLSAYYTKLEVDGLLADKLEADDFESNQTASANPITLETKQAGLAKSCVVEMNPIQDLHGYSNPWVGGAGKNKIDYSSAIKDITSQGLTFKQQTNFKIKVTGNASSGALWGFTTNFSNLPNGNYKIYVESNLSGVSFGVYSGTTSKQSLTVNQFNNFELTSDKATWNIAMVAVSSISNVNTEISVMLVNDNVTDATFAPYSNICPISGRTEASVKRTGVNQWDEVTQLGYLDGGTGTVYPSYTDRLCSKNFCECIGNHDYYCKNGHTSGLTLVWYDKNQAYIRQNSFNNNVITSPANAKYYKIGFPSNYGTTYNNNVSLNYISTDTDYHAYTAETHTKEFGQTVYGGKYDAVSGKLVVTEGYKDLGTLTWTKHSDVGRFYAHFSAEDNVKPSTSSTVAGGLICSQYVDSAQSSLSNGKISIDATPIPYINIIDLTKSDLTADQFKTAMDGVQLCYALATLITIQLSPEALTLLKGLNVISTDGDKVQVEFSDIPVGDYSVLLDYIKSLEARIAAVEP